MSQTHIRVSRPPSRRRFWVAIAIAFGVPLIPVVYMVARAESWFAPAYNSADGTVLETRTVVDHYDNGEFGGSIYYRLEAHVQYSVPDASGIYGLSELQDRWLNASDPTTTPELLTVTPQKHPKSCRVYWIPKHPETAKCEFI